MYHARRNNYGSVDYFKDGEIVDKLDVPEKERHALAHAYERDIHHLPPISQNLREPRCLICGAPGIHVRYGYDRRYYLCENHHLDTPENVIEDLLNGST